LGIALGHFAIGSNFLAILLVFRCPTSQVQQEDEVPFGPVSMCRIETYENVIPVAIVV
jgi:hypothetical protein